MSLYVNRLFLQVVGESREGQNKKAIICLIYPFYRRIKAGTVTVASDENPVR